MFDISVILVFFLFTYYNKMNPTEFEGTSETIPLTSERTSETAPLKSEGRSNSIIAIDTARKTVNTNDFIV